jgi:transcription antitermination factor NusG
MAAQSKIISRFETLMYSIKWYVMRDLKRSNTLSPAYKVLSEKHLEVFTPLQWRVRNKKGIMIREQVPFLPDLLFVHASREILNPFVDTIPTLQYRYVRGGKYKEGMIVSDTAMNRFIYAVKSSPQTEYFTPSELTPENIGSHIRIVEGPLNGYTGHLLNVRKSGKKKLLVEIPNLLTAAIEIEPEYIQIIK